MLATDNTTALDQFLVLCCAEIQRRADIAERSPDVLRQGAAAFRTALQHASVISAANDLSATMPVLATLDSLASSQLADAAVAVAGEIPWQPTPRVQDSSSTVGLGRIDQVRDLGGVQCGLMLVAPGEVYPEHGHPPQEIYLPIAGNGQWRCGGATDYRQLESDELVYNHPHDVHGVIAGVEPLLAMFILWP